LIAVVMAFTRSCCHA